MTITQALTAAVQVPGIDSLTLEKACIDADLAGADPYEKSIEKEVDLAAVNVLRSLVVTSEQEGGFAYSVSPEFLKNRISFLLAKWGVADEATSSQPKIRSVNRW